MGTLIYTIFKDVWNYFKCKEKQVSYNWPEKSGLVKKMEKQGYKLRWSNRDKLEENVQKGYKIYYQKKCLVKKYCFVNKSNQVLLRKKTANDLN